MFKREKDLYHKMMEPRKFQLNQHTVKLSLNGVEEEYVYCISWQKDNGDEKTYFGIKKIYKYCILRF